MPHVCPRPCSRLATAAVFISVGVVQFVVGIILLRSKYVFLLAGPDFWTATCNIAVGCLLGLSASIWKQSRKRLSKKHILRRNLLLALLFSALILNATTLGIFLLGEGNTLLSIRLENGGKYDHSTFASEVLAYAYVTSVCCPIICIVVTIVSMSGSCFKHVTRNKLLEMKTPVNDVEKRHSKTLRWIYTPELYDLPKKKLRDLFLSSSESSSDDDDSGNVSTHQKYSYSSEDLQHVLNRMAEGKRDSILSDSAIMLRQMDLRRKSRYDSLNQDESYMGPVLSRTRESVFANRNSKDHSNFSEDRTETRSGKSRRDSDFNGSMHILTGDAAMKRINFAKGKQLGLLYKNPYTSEELLDEYQTAASKLVKHYPSQYKKFRERVKTRSEIEDPPLSYTCDVSRHEIRNIPGIHKKTRMTKMENKGKDSPSDYGNLTESKESEKRKVHQRNEIVKGVSSPDDCFSPDGSEFGDLTFDLPRRNSWVGDVVPINIKQSSAVRFSHKLIPVASPVIPSLPQTRDIPRVSDDSGISTIESTSFIESANDSDSKDKRHKFSSFREDSKVQNNDDIQEYPKMGSQSVKKYDLNRVVTMESISEEPRKELNKFEEISEKSYSSQDDGMPKTWKSHSRNKSLSSVQSEVWKTTNQDGDSSERDLTPKKKRSASSKALRKILSLAVNENRTDFLDQVVDEDSLIGLTEEELIARQLRTRSIRKTVQKRMKEVTAI